MLRVARLARMARECKVCNDIRRDEIESTFRTKGPRATGRMFDMPHQTVMRHFDPKHQARVQSLPPKVPYVEPPPLPDGTETLTRENVIASFTTYKERRAYLESLLIAGRFRGERTLVQLESIWGISREDMALLVSQAQDQVDFARGSIQTRRYELITSFKRLARKAEDAGKHGEAARILMNIAKVDSLISDSDWQAGLFNSASWRIVARVLQEFHPDAFTRVHAELAAVNDQKTRALAPYTVEAEGGTE